jgi:hypothetical protein
LFFDGFPTKGRCASGAGHVAQRDGFVLRCRGILENDQVLVPVRE